MFRYCYVSIFICQDAYVSVDCTCHSRVIEVIISIKPEKKKENDRTAQRRINYACPSNHTSPSPC